MDWQYENEVRLIVYNPNNTAEHYGIELDNNSEIEAIYFGYRCPDATITTIKNLFKFTLTMRFYIQIWQIYIL